MDHRGLGDVNTLTVRDYLALSSWGLFCYHLYRHPIVMFGIGPTYLFVLQQRLPIGMLRGGWRSWLSTMATNFAIALLRKLRIGNESMLAATSSQAHPAVARLNVPKPGV